MIFIKYSQIYIRYKYFVETFMLSIGKTMSFI